MLREEIEKFESMDVDSFYELVVVIIDKLKKFQIISKQISTSKRENEEFHGLVTCLQKDLLHPTVSRFVMKLEPGKKLNLLKIVFLFDWQMESIADSLEKEDDIEESLATNNHVLAHTIEFNGMSFYSFNQTKVLRITISNVAKKLTMPNLHFDTRMIIKDVLEIFLSSHHRNFAYVPRLLFECAEFVDFEEFGGYDDDYEMYISEREDLENSTHVEYKSASVVSFLASLPDKLAKYPEFRYLYCVQPENYWQRILDEVFKYPMDFYQDEKMMLLLFEKVYRVGHTRCILNSMKHSITLTNQMKMQKILSKLPLHIFESILNLNLLYLNKSFQDSSKLKSISENQWSIEVLELVGISPLVIHHLGFFDLISSEGLEKFINFLSNSFMISNVKLNDEFVLALLTNLKEGSHHACDFLAKTLADKWAQKRFVACVSYTTIFNIGLTLLLALNRVQKSTLEYLHRLILPNLGVFLDMSHKPSKELGLILAEEISQKMEFDVALNFELDNTPYIMYLRALSKGKVTSDLISNEQCVDQVSSFQIVEKNELTQKLSESSINEVPFKKDIKEKLPLLNSLGDSDDEDDEFEPFESSPGALDSRVSQEIVGKDVNGNPVRVPRHVRECLEYLTKDDDRIRLTAALNELPYLIAMCPKQELYETINELIESVSNLRNSLDICDFDELKSRSILSAIHSCPFEALQSLRDIFYRKDTHFGVKMNILSWIGNVGWTMTNSLIMEHPFSNRNNVHNILYDHNKLEPNSSVQDVHQLSKKVIGKTKWRSSKLEKLKKSSPNRFLEHAEAFVMLFLTKFPIETIDQHYLNQILAAHFVKTMAVLVYCSAHAPAIQNIYVEYIHLLLHVYRKAPLNTLKTAVLSDLHQSILFGISTVLNLALVFENILCPLLFMPFSRIYSSSSAPIAWKESTSTSHRSLEFRPTTTSIFTELKTITNDMYLLLNNVNEETKDLVIFCQQSLNTLELNHVTF